jgi:hypothetical protein
LDEGEDIEDIRESIAQSIHQMCALFDGEPDAR